MVMNIIMNNKYEFLHIKSIKFNYYNIALILYTLLYYYKIMIIFLLII